MFLMRATLAAGLAVTALSMSGQEPAKRESPGPSLLLSATASDVLSFAGAAVARGIPVGVVASKSTRKNPRRGAIPATDSRPEDIYTVIERFNTTHADYKTEFKSGVLIVQDEALPHDIVELLSKRHQRVESPIESFAMFLRIGDLLALRPNPGGGVMGSGPSAGCPVRVPVTVKTEAPTTRDLLDAMAIQAHIGWMLFFDLGAASDSLELGYLCPDSSYTYYTVRGW